MKILYAVQGTGNGHITRARIMAKALRSLNVDVDWVFTGRPKDELFDMQDFGDFRVFSGLTYAIKHGKIQYVQTAFKNNLFKFLRDVFRFDFTGYDLVINDFEPVIAWAAKRAKVKTIGLSHQMAFQKDIPMAGENILAKFVLRHFAPVDLPIGLHWSDFGQHLLPPIIDDAPERKALSLRDVLVYCPFSTKEELIDWFAPFGNYRFHVFHGCDDDSGYKHINLYPFSRSHFQEKQSHCAGVITSAGFELPSEALQVGQKLLIKPLGGQMEQTSNALALDKIKRATIIDKYTNRTLEQWLQEPPRPAIQYPNVALEVAKWLVNSERESLESLSKKLWEQTKTLTNFQTEDSTHIEKQGSTQLNYT
ncbi:glycosyl transferase [Aliikangiella marina]|uniref:Glycosyl transferase n=1 Tax=Aliikangiella marina TaxID=1712262 RepID=A0A545T700_9GAMM|nr:MJ1255/VC2487 family glycosyltransferase [Aliikangiella marina]TQV72996.1 glycosyl transferase [Aliikangiella marina]